MASFLIRQFDVFENEDPASATEFPFLAVLQSDAVYQTTSVIVAPFVERPTTITSERTQPLFTVRGRRLALILTDLAAIPRVTLRQRVTNLADGHDRIMSGLDLLFVGF